jgi:hypothetical protein
MRYVNEHLVKKKFKFEGLKDLADMAEKGDHAISFEFTSGYYHVDCTPALEPTPGLSGRVGVTVTIAFPLGSPQSRGYSRK